jgi:hypothetical protein
MSAGQFFRLAPFPANRLAGGWIEAQTAIHAESLTVLILPVSVSLRNASTNQSLMPNRDRCRPHWIWSTSPRMA